MITNKNKTAWLMWSVGALFFLVQYFPRLAPGIMLPDLIDIFHVSAVQLGTLAFLFYIGYISMQIPAGMLLDRYGSRALIIVAAGICAISCVWFALSESFSAVMMARFILGFGAAFAFVSAVKLATVWFPAHRLGVMVGITQGLGMLGAALGDAPLRHLMNRMGWRGSLWLMAIFFVFIVVMAFYWLKKPKKNISQDDERYRLLEGFVIVLKNPQNWMNALYVGMLYVPTIVFGEFWGVVFMEKVHHLSSVGAAFMVSLIFIGFGVGSVVLGWLSDLKGDRKRFMLVTAAVSLLLGVLMLYVPLPHFYLLIVVFCFGFANAGVSISYTLSGELNPRSVAGTSVAFANMASILVGALIQPLIGYLVQWHWSGKMLHGAHLYSAHDYQFAMISIVAALSVSVVAAYFIKNPKS